MNTNPNRLFSRRFAAAFIALCLFVTALPAIAGAGQVNVNTASVEELQLLPRIGPAVAARIVEHREKNGAFKAAEDLMLVRGIGESTFEQLKAYVTLSGATTLAEKVRSPKKSKDAAAPAKS